MDIRDFVKLTRFEELCKEKKIRISRDGEYMLLKYEPDADFTDDIVRKCRGIIFKNGVIVCRPFDKFCNYGEQGADDIDWNTARVQSKIDGSLVKLFYDKYWHWATNGSISADKTAYGNTTFFQMIQNADNYKDIPYDILDKNKTYMFELVGPENRVVINYPKAHLYHIGTRTLGGVESNDDIGIEKPKEYDIHSIDDCIRVAEEMNPGDEIVEEGFVVVDKDYHRIKVKSPKYILMHRAINNGIVTTKRILDAIREGTDEVYYRTEQTRVKYLKVKCELAYLEYEVESEMHDARALYQEYDFDRKRTVDDIKKMKYPFAGYAALGTTITARDVISKMSTSKIEQLIKKNQ